MATWAPGVIFVNADATRPMMAVIGHELLHQLKNESKALYEVLDSRLAKVLREPGRYRDALAAKYEKQGLKPTDSWMEELHADIVGDFFTEAQFWQDMAAEQPGLFKKVAMAIKRFLDSVIDKVWATRPFGTEQYVTDLEAARAAVVEAMRQYGGSQVGAMTSQSDGINLSVADTIRTSQDLVDAKGGVFDFNRLGTTGQDRVRTAMDGSRPFWLGLLTRDQIADVYGKEIESVKDYDSLTRAMENERQKMAGEADELYTDWAKLPAEVNDRLARIMLEATVHQVHPDGDYDGANAERKAVHARISTAYKLLPKDAQAMYRRVKAYHADTLSKLVRAVEGRIQRQVKDGKARAAALTNIRKMFDKYLEDGPYFPLSRFGDFLVIATRGDKDRVVATYETAGEQQAAARELEKEGFTVKLKTTKTYSRELDGSAGKFIGDVLSTVDSLDFNEASVGGKTADLKAKMLDDLNQLFIRALPDLSYRKHFLHRKNTPGFSGDVMRGFASSAFHAASHIARLNHGDKMTFALQDAYDQIERAPEGDFNLHSQVLNELSKRHDAALNPNTHPIAAMLSQVGFVMYLGLSPAAGLVNALQTVMVTMPHLGARYGFGKTNSTMASAYKDILAAKPNAKNGWNAAQSPKLTSAERAAMSKLQDEGVIDLTQAHDLAAATGIDTGNVARSKAAFAMARAMKIVGWTFHIPEVMNRQVTALSAYRLEMERSGDQAKAMDAAREAIKRTQFDYSACVDADTDILTSVGWKRYDTLAKGDTAIAVDDAGRAVPSSVQDVNVYHGDHEVIDFASSRRFSMVVTPQHDCVIQTYNSKSKSWGALRKERADELKNHFYVLRTPLAPLDSGEGGMGEDFAALLGWVAAEGWYAKFRNCKTATNVRLGQSLSHNPEYVEEIRGVLQRLGGEFTAHENKRKRDTLVTFSLRRSLGRRIQGVMPNKVLTPELVSSMSGAEMRAFIWAFLKGDGSVDESGKRWAVGQKNGTNLDLLQAMATMCGMRATLSPVNGNGLGVLYVVPDDAGCRSHVRPLAQQRRTVPLVWCPTTEHGTWIARRNGAVFVTGNSNRARFMQGNVARVVTQFKQYSQNMTYLLGRAAHQALLGEDPEVRAIARKQLVATMGVTFAMAGALGLPGIGAVMGLIGMMVGAMDDDDKPWDWKVEFRNLAADAFGKEAGEVLSKGLPRALMPWDISNRVSLSDLWWRDNGREGMNPREAFANDMQNILGPSAGTLLGLYTAADHMARGHWSKAVESMVPKALRDPLKGVREASEGVTTYTGEPLMDTTATENIGRMLGFAPARASEMFEARNAVKNAETAITEKRQRLLSTIVKARMDRDTETAREIQAEIAEFNRRNPAFRITSETITKSQVAKMKSRSQTRDGIRLAPKRDELRAIGRFAEVD